MPTPKREKGHFVDWKDLSSEQMKEVIAMYPLSLRNGGFRHEWCAYYIMPTGHLTKARGRHQFTKEGGRLALQFNTQVPVRPEKGDLSAWKSGATFHFSHG